jgi:hypothetical protein
MHDQSITPQLEGVEDATKSLFNHLEEHCITTPTNGPNKGNNIELSNLDEQSAKFALRKLGHSKQ